MCRISIKHTRVMTEKRDERRLSLQFAHEKSATWRIFNFSTSALYVFRVRMKRIKRRGIDVSKGEPIDRFGVHTVTYLFSKRTFLLPVC